MLSPAWLVARKETIDSLRDTRALISALMYALMGPAVVYMVSLATRVDGVVIAMMSVFALVSAFVGGMNVAMDTVAGERERQSLLPLLMNPVDRRDIVKGKWMAVALFSLAGLLLNLFSFAVLFPSWNRAAFLAMAAGMLPLALFAASVQLLISTACRATKEAQTYLSMLVFLPMGAGMFLVFFPQKAAGWFRWTPVLGQQLQFESWMKGGAVPLAPAAALGCFTAAVALLVLEGAARRLRRDAQEAQFDRLMTANGPALARLAASYTDTRGDRDDLLQEIALAIWRALPAFRGECSERTFLFRVAHNRAIAYLVRHRIRFPAAGEGWEARDPAPDPESGLAREQSAARLHRAIRGLPLLYRQAIMLALEGLGYAEIAEVLGISESNVGARLSRARQLLREALEKRK